MKIKDLLSVILPTIYKKDLVDLLYNAQREIKEVSLPVLEEMDKDFRSWNFRSREVKRLDPTFRALVKKRQGNIITTTKFALTNALSMADEVKPVVERNFNDANVASALSYRKAQYIQFIDAIKFYSEYARLFANYVIVCETGEFDRGNTIKNRLTPAQVKKVENGFNSFCQLTNVFNMRVADVMKLLNDVPDVLIVPENIEMVESSLGKTTVDPLRFGFISATFNPFYAIQVKLALWGHQKYEKALEERELLRLRLLNLQRHQSGTPDPKIESEIEYYEDRVQKLDAQIAKVEQEYA